MAEITVTEVDPEHYRVIVEEAGSSTEHQVGVGPSDLEGLPEGPTTADLVAASFRFLLDREPKESILPRFELGVIGRYFPEYEDEIAGYL